MKLKNLIEQTAHYYSKILEYNRDVADCIFTIFSDHTKYDNLDPYSADIGLKEYSVYVDSISKLETTNVNIYQSLTDKITDMVEKTRGWNEYFLDVEKLKKEKTEAFKSYEYYVNKLKKLKSNTNSDKTRLERNELKCIKAHSEYFTKAYKAYSHLEKLSKNLYSKVNPALISIYNFQKELYIETAKTYLEIDNIEHLLIHAEKKYYLQMTENTNYNPMIYDKEIEDLIVDTRKKHHSSDNLLKISSYKESPKKEEIQESANKKPEDDNFFSMLKNRFSINLGFKK